ncbi:MAG: hypothetical protein KC496_01465 [Anaerolineae bacterium]|nr:hypothetical protein [Anaerolineae bacterium]
MFSSIANAIVAICTSLITFAGAINKVAQTVDNLASVSEETSGQYLDDTRAKRAENLKAIAAKAAS